jgi:putative flippase GtrA
MRSGAPAELGRIARFGAVGVVNTIVGYSAIVAGLFLGFGDVPANLAGFSIGFAVSFVLNSRWTFAGGGAPGSARLLRYLAAFAVAYLCNLAVMLAARTVLGAENPLAHLAGMIAYVAIFYLASRFFVFVSR